MDQVKKKLGEILLETGLISDFQLQSALSYQRTWGGKLGSTLVALKFVREEDVLRVLAQKLHMIYVDLFEPEVSESVLQLVKPDVAKRYSVIPVAREGDELVLAMSDPLDAEACGAIQFATGLGVRPALALDSEIKSAIRKYYDHENVVVERRRAALPVPAGVPAAEAERVQAQEPVPVRAAPVLPEIGPRAQAAPRPAEPLAAAPVDGAARRVDALIELLVERGLVTRAELQRKGLTP